MTTNPVRMGFILISFDLHRELALHLRLRLHPAKKKHQALRIRQPVVIVGHAECFVGVSYVEGGDPHAAFRLA
ncbi:hypothetical protein ACFL5Q_07835 [Planctomycetota bacterium]